MDKMLAMRYANFAIRKGRTVVLNGALLVIAETLRTETTPFISFRIEGEDTWRNIHRDDKINTSK